MNQQNKTNAIRNCLIDLQKIIEQQDDNEWLKGIKATINSLTNRDGSVSFAGFQDAKSIYKTMTEGGRGFSEYNIWSEDESERLCINKELDHIRSKLWVLFDL